ncbi:MAG: AMP-binding protein [Saonia sp.]
MIPSYNKIHNQFKLNGISFTREDLKEVGYSLIKEGEPYEVSIGDFLLDWLSDTPKIQVMTSGSTGKPKLISLQKQAMVNSAIATGDFFGISVGNNSLLCLSADYIAGKMMLVRAMILGMELDYVAPTSQPLASTRKAYDFVAMVPLQLERSLDSIDRIKTIIVGGAPLSDSLKEKVGEKRINIFETYGMTETITHIAAKKITFGPSTSNSHSDYFKLLPHIKIEKDQRNCLVVHAPKIWDAPIITNDLVSIISDTEFQWLGRYDNIINSGGVKIIPEQIENKLSSLIKGRFFVWGISDRELGQKLILMVEGVSDTEKLLHTINTSGILKKYELPKEVYSLEKFAETKNGKIQRERSLKLVQISD